MTIAWLVFAVAALAILWAGQLLAKSAERIARATGLSLHVEMAFRAIAGGSFFSHNAFSPEKSQITAPWYRMAGALIPRRSAYGRAEARERPVARVTSARSVNPDTNLSTGGGMEPSRERRVPSRSKANSR